MVWNNQQTIKKSWFERFSDQPHQLFFSSGLSFGIFFMILSFLSLVGINIDFYLVHTLGLIFGLFINAILGFLFTVIPRYTKSILIKKADYLIIWVLYEIGVILLIVGFENIAKAIIGSSLIYTSTIFFDTILNGLEKKQKESWYLSLLVFLAGLISLISVFYSFNFVYIILWWVLFPIVFVVAQRMIPAFYGVYFNTTPNTTNKLFLPLFVFGFFIIGLDIDLLTTAISFIMGLVLVYFILSNNLLKKAPAILSILTIGLIWLCIGFFVMSIEKLFIDYSFSLSLHIFTIGFLSTLLVGFGYRVVLGHSGNKILADKVAIIMFSMLHLTLLSRIIASIFFIFDINAYIGFIHLGFIFWIVLFFVWFIKQGRLLIRF